MDWNVFFMGASVGVAFMCLAAGLPWWIFAINVFAAILQAIAVFS